MRRSLALAGLLLALLSAVAVPLAAQPTGVVQSDILLLDPERVLNDTVYGQRLLADIQTERDELVAHNRRVEAELEAEEKSLTERRPNLSPEEFRDLADAFDQKVQQLRQDSERMSRDLERQRELIPLQFMRVIEPVLAGILNDSGGVVIMDVRAVLLRSGVADITELAIERVNEQIGEGPANGPRRSVETPPKAPAE
ncbi:OmpH family outer membrane protein [uncultured Roseovarius sp.]|uniref:OmpH family outer membrane protein n=1 Tax=Roseovarius sp. TaxID=1486281 RepID=UPI0025D3F3C7|nr:OmpH family outer membrane protein [uncultured Roseovarius sp.]